MSNAWETTDEDIINVVRDIRKGKIANTRTVERILKNLDHAAIEKAALHGNDLDKQTQYAHEEIKRQIIKKGI
jgi:ribosome maturation protein Sdo1